MSDFVKLSNNLIMNLDHVVTIDRVNATEHDDVLLVTTVTSGVTITLKYDSVDAIAFLNAIASRLEIK